MELKDQVCSLESAKRLKELGIPHKDSIFHWVHEDGEWHIEYNASENFWPAFTVAELGELLLSEYADTHKGIDDIWRCGKNEAIVDDEVEGEMVDIVWAEGFQKANTEAEARAKMLIYLLENKLMTLGGQDDN